MAAAVILEFQKLKIVTVDPLPGPICVIVPNFIKIGRTVAEIWRFNGFFQNGAGRYLGFLGAISIVVPNLVTIDTVISIT